MIGSKRPDLQCLMLSMVSVAFFICSGCAAPGKEHPSAASSSQVSNLATISCATHSADADDGAIRIYWDLGTLNECGSRCTRCGDLVQVCIVKNGSTHTICSRKGSSQRYKSPDTDGSHKFTGLDNNDTYNYEIFYCYNDAGNCTYVECGSGSSTPS